MCTTSPRTIKKVQIFNRKMAALGRFLARSENKSLLFFRSLKDHLGKGTITWMEEAKEDLVRLKGYMENMPMMASLKVGEPLVVCLSSSMESISAMLVAERSTKQVPVYFVSQVLQGTELNYSIIEKLMLALFYTTRRLRRYFQAHPITVLTNQPIRKILIQPKHLERMTRWAIELGEHDITYRPRAIVRRKS